MASVTVENFVEKNYRRYIVRKHCTITGEIGGNPITVSNVEKAEDGTFKVIGSEENQSFEGVPGSTVLDVKWTNHSQYQRKNRKAADESASEDVEITEPASDEIDVEEPTAEEVTEFLRGAAEPKSVDQLTDAELAERGWKRDKNGKVRNERGHFVK